MNPDLRTRHMWRDQPSRMQCWNIRNASYNQLQLVPRPNCLWAFIWKPIVTKVTLVITKFEISHCKKYLSSSICDVLTICLISDWYTGSFLIPVKSNFLIGQDFLNGLSLYRVVSLTWDWEIYGFQHQNPKAKNIIWTFLTWWSFNEIGNRWKTLKTIENV